MMTFTAPLCFSGLLISMTDPDSPPTEPEDSLKRLMGDVQAARDGGGKGEPPAEESSSPLDPKPGLVLGDYRLTGQLGAGGMGTVWEAEQVSLGRPVALKLLSTTFSFSERAVERFRREAEAGGRIAHPGIVQVFEVGEAGGAQFIAQELVRGGLTLTHKFEDLRKKSDLSLPWYKEAAGLFSSIADALAIAHDAGVIHRDIKPGNILLGSDGQPKVADFGLAHVENALELSRTGDFAGTPFYMSPEQAAARRMGIDERTDIFSLGATFYEALTLRRPFEGDTYQQVLKRVLVEDPVDPRKVRSKIPPDLAVICLKALEKDPDRRFASMAEFAADLRHFLDDEPITARPPNIAQRVRKWGRRHPVLVTSGAIAAGGFALVSWLVIDNYQRKRTAEGDRDLARHSETVALADKATAEHAIDFMIKLFEAMDPQEARGRRFTARELVAEGERLLGEDEKAEMDRAIKNRLQEILNQIYGSLGGDESPESG